MSRPASDLTTYLENAEMDWQFVLASAREGTLTEEVLTETAKTLTNAATKMRREAAAMRERAAS